MASGAGLITGVPGEMSVVFDERKLNFILLKEGRQKF